MNALVTALPTAVEGALMSSLCYKEYEQTLLMRHPDAIMVKNKNARAIIVNREDVVDIAFAGSDDCGDWKGNAMRDKVERGGIGKVYDGVADYYGLLRDGVHGAISDDDKPMRLFGHSLGGAAAEMFAARRIANGKPVACLHTYGSPMVGDAEFCEVSAEIPDAHNWWLKGDVVPYQPKALLFFSRGYKRARDPHVIDGIKVSAEIPFWTPPIMRWIRKGLTHSCYDGYYEALLRLQRTVTP